ncbi:MAG TPA: TIR domain-containing protein [Pyrinomonadaceae bacterium]|nr:TIR domain-containing protein [Pyrinomonadaceae bacterium]
MQGNDEVHFNLLRTLKGHTRSIFDIAWSPDGSMIGSASRDGTLKLWNAESGKQFFSSKAPKLQNIDGLYGPRKGGESHQVYGLAWSPDGTKVVCSERGALIRAWQVNPPELAWASSPGVFASALDWSPNGQLIAAACYDGSVRLIDAATGRLLPRTLDHQHTVMSLAWSPDGKLLASSSWDKKIFLWDSTDWKLHQKLRGHSKEILGIAWSPSGDLLASACNDTTIGIWNPRTGQLTAILEGHTEPVKRVSFSFDGRFLASQSDDRVRIWRTDNYEMVGGWREHDPNANLNGLAFHPHLLRLAFPTLHNREICIWDLTAETVLDAQISQYTHYTNAKVVLVGDTGVGKSGLALVLTGQPWKETGSTHGRRVWVLDREEVENAKGFKESREILLWDLAGQPDYRPIHQLQLTEVAIALVVFDSRSQTDPFAGVRYWDRAVRQAQRVQPSASLTTQKYLVAARVDVGRIGASADRIELLRRDLEFDRYFATSAKEGWGVKELLETIRNSINWQALPTVSSTELFRNIKTFLVKEKESGRLLSSTEDLYRAYLKASNTGETEDLPAQFETCIGRVESSGLIQRLSFGNLILLQPELQDVYASAIANAVKDEPDGLGCIKEEKARAGQFRMPVAERIKDPQQEELLLISTVEDLLRHEIALREQGEDGQYLVFPSQLTRENPDLPDPEGKAVIFNFEGPILNIYATLAVRLSYSGFFKKKEMWKNAATYSTPGAGTCGMFLRELNEGRGELTLFFNPETSEESRFQFEEYVRVHLERKALPESIHRRRIFVCDECGTPVLDVAAKRRKERSFDWIACNVCEPVVRISLLDREERMKADRVARIFDLDRAVETQREIQTAASVIHGKIATSDFDVFLCHNRKDKTSVKMVGELLKERGILPWLDEWELQPGVPWQPALEKQIEQIKSAAVFVGEEGIGPWQQQELDAFLREFVSRKCPVIPVLLDNAQRIPSLPVFLKGMVWVDFRNPDPDPLSQLIWGITGQREFGREYERLTLMK